MHSDVALRPEPQSAGRARAWIRAQLLEMGRPELVDTAELATSELVTNAILHARTRITLAVSDQGDEVLIEVGDASTKHLKGTRTDPSPEGSLTTVGNGLHIIGALARRWGVRERGASGKTVWFVPATAEEEARAEPRFPPDLLLNTALDTTDTVDVVVRDAPVQLLWESRFRVRDLRREMALLSMQPAAQQGLPYRVLRLAAEIDQVHPAVLSDDGTFRRAFTDRAERVNLHYMVPRRVGPACAQLADLLDEADDFCRDAKLLTLAAPAEEQQMRRWFLCEFARQVRDEPATPWSSPEAAKQC